MTDLVEAPLQAEQLDDAARTSLVMLATRGMLRVEIDAPLQSLVDAGLAMARNGIIVATAQGKLVAAAILQLPADSEARGSIDTLFDTFLPLNWDLRQVCSDWQCRADGSPNDHSDAAYDVEVRDRLDDIHTAISPVLRRLAAVEPRYAEYKPRLDESLEKLDAGDNAWFTSPLIDSYHTVWMHLHQDLLLTLGISRADDEERERELVERRGA